MLLLRLFTLFPLIMFGLFIIFTLLLLFQSATATSFPSSSGYGRRYGSLGARSLRSMAMPPVAKKMRHEMEMFGDVRVDDYYWLRDDYPSNPEVLSYLHAENNYTEQAMSRLRIAPPEAPVTGYMFGKGVYFADMFSKSANYCFASSDSTAGVLLLCEVALGDMAELLTANNRADLLPDGKLSTKGVGATEPDMSQAEKLEDGLVVPLGRPKKQENVKGSLLYNEYIVYNVEQIRMRYLIQVNFNYR